jgi:hypothetical protein
MEIEYQSLLSDEELDEMMERCAVATPGPWRSYIEGRDHTSGDSFIMTGEGSHRGEDIYLIGATKADQDFVARARQDVPRLIEEVRRLKQALRDQSAS